MGKTYTRSLFFLFFFICSLIPLLSRSEGTKEVCPSSSDGGNIYLSSPPGYTYFANYNATPNYRLYIHVGNVDETILFGFRCLINNVAYRLKDPAGNIVLSGTAPTATNGQPGLISNYTQAVAGPFPANGGYTPREYKVIDPTALGDYYIEFNSTSTQLDLYDFTVVTGLNSPAIPTDVILGRVFSKSWQFYSPLGASGPFFSGKFFVYSDDGIVTRCSFSQARVGAFTLFCNQYGVTNSGVFTNDRKSVNNNTTTTFPGIAQYKVFLNDPDINVYPNGVYGAMTVGPSVIPDPAFSECSGKKLIVVTVNKAGNVEIIIDVPYGPIGNDVQIYASVINGINYIPWDGKDGMGVQVPDGTSISVTVSYVNGLTNLPLWDIEQNPQGFNVSLVRPISTIGTNPMMYWDDTMISGTGNCPTGSNLTGCIPSNTPPVPGCHPWGSGIPTGDCHDKMVNTWWYSASSSTATINVYYAGTPAPPVPDDSTRCGNGMVLLAASVSTDQTVDWYATITGGAPLLSGSLTFITPVLSATTTYYAQTRNIISACLSNTRTPVIATINQIPAAPSGVVLVPRCGTGTVTFNAIPTTNTVRWYNVPVGGVILFTGNNFTTPSLSVNTTYYAESEDPATKCISTGRTAFSAEIRPVPAVNNGLLTQSICSATSTNILLSSNVGGSTFAWTTVVLTGTVTGNSAGSGNPVAQVLTNTGVVNGTVQYSVTPTANSCVGNSTNFSVTVFPKPQVTTSVVPTEICSGVQYSPILTSNVLGATFKWIASGTANTSGFSSGLGNNFSHILTNSSFVNGTVTYKVVAQANGCFGDTTLLTVIIKPLPDLSNSPPQTYICNNTSPNINLTSNVAATQFTWTTIASSGFISGYSDNAIPAVVINQSLSNSGFTTEYVVYHLIPVANGCIGPVSTYTVYVYPSANLSNLPLSKQICSEALTNIVLTSNVTGTLFTWTAFCLSGNITGYTDNSIPGISLNEQLFNSGNTSENVIYSITPESNGCTSNPVNYTVSVKPTPDVSNVPLLKSICNNTTTGIVLTSNVAGALFTWSATGSSGNISGFVNNSVPALTINQTLLNIGYTNETVTYHITPGANGCNGAIYDYTVTVFPSPDLSNLPLSKSICSNTATSINLTSNVTGALFTWTASGSTGNVTGFSDNSIPGIFLNQSLINSGSVTEQVTYLIQPLANGCNGGITSFTVNVYPVPDLSNNPRSKSICNNDATNINLTSNVTGTLFTWTAIGSSGNVIGFSDNSGSPTTILNQNLSNTGFNIETVTYSITPHANGCDGNSVNYVVTVYPSANVIFSPPSATICSGVTTNVNLTSDVTGATFTWTATSGSAIANGFGNGSGILIAQTLNNTGITPETVTYLVTPVANSCTGNPSSVIVTVNPVSVVSSLPIISSACSNVLYSLALTASVTGTTYTWIATPTSPSISGHFPGSGALISQTIVNSGFTTESVNYVVTPSSFGCSGTPSTYTRNVFPKPDLSNTPLSGQICSGNNTNLPLYSNVTGTIFDWTCTPSSANITGYTIGTGIAINQVLINLGLVPESVIYHITPSSNGCLGDIRNYTMNIAQVPDVYFNPSIQTICSQQTSSVNILSQVGGTTFTWIATGSSPNVSGYSNGSGNLIAQNLVNTGNLPGIVTYIVSPAAFGCPPGISQSVDIIVNPLPRVINAITNFQICSSTPTNIPLQSDINGTIFSWTASGSSGFVTGYSNSSGPIIIQTLSNGSFINEIVTYIVTPQSAGCDGYTGTFQVTVFPVADVVYNAGSQNFCSGTATAINISSNVAGSSFTWTASGSSPNVNGYSGGSGNLIQQTLINSGNLIEYVIYSTTPVANGCIGTSGSVTDTVNPPPVVSYNGCMDQLTTTNSKPFRLKGGIPSGGSYSGAGVIAGFFNPTFAGTGNHIIVYSYTNTWSCNDSKVAMINVVNPVISLCGNTITDIRDNNVYPTVQIGTQCWMASNLNYGNITTSGSMQRDNCIPERYCFGDNMGNCSVSGGLYQWDEVMQYELIASEQGLCPPGWHIPSESEWKTLFTFYTSNGFAGNPLKNTGYSGFNAMLSGNRFDNVNWNYDTFAIILWSSSSHGTYKAWGHGMNTYNPSVSIYPTNRSNGFAVRCLKD